MRTEASVLALLFLAGCVSPAATESTAVAPQSGAQPQIVGTGTGCSYFCEPAVAIDPSGAIFVLGDSLGVSKDGGATFESVPTPPVPPPADFHGDSLIQVGPDGALYHSSLLQGCIGGCQVILLHGIQVSRTDDGGESWSQTVLRFPEPQSPGSDRQWLAFGADGLVCLTYQRYGPAFVYGVPAYGRLIVGVDNNVVASCSEDGGATFPPMTTVLPPGHQGGSSRVHR